MKPTFSLVLFVVAATLLSGCLGDADPKTVSVTLIPQNHSGKAYQLQVEVVDVEGATKFDRNYTLGAMTHTGPTAKLSLLTGTYIARVEAARSDPPDKKTNGVIEFKVVSGTKQVLVMIEPNETLAVRAS
jgi:hypothetical protein